MEKNKLAVIGSWDWDGSDTQKGITVCRVNEKTGKLSGFANYLPDVKCASTPDAGKDNIIYFADEQKAPAGRKTGGGGKLYAAKINEKGKAEIISEVPSLGVNPSYCCIDASGKYLIAVHHTSSRDSATVLKKNRKGEVVQEIIYDDAAIVLFELNEDGTIGKPADYQCHKSKNGKVSLLHSVYRLPESDLLIICDKGLDQIYSYTIRKGKLVLKDTLKVPDGSDPRYAAFHPEKPLIYVCNEQRTCLYTVRCIKKTGRLQLIKETELIDEPLIAMASDIAVHDGYVYTALRFADVISVCRLDQRGIPKLIQTIPCGGVNARGIAISKDGRYLYSCNTESDVITVFRIQKNGTLKQSSEISVGRPSSLRFL